MIIRSSLCLLIFVMLASCSKHGPTGSLLVGDGAAPVLLPPEIEAALPGLPVDNYTHPLKATAQADAVLSGSQAQQLSSGAQVSGESLQLDAAPAGLEWAIYQFSGAPGEVITGVGCSAAGLAGDEALYLAVSDYESGRWKFMPAQTTATLSHAVSDAPGRWQSPLGSTFIAIVGFDSVSFAVDNVQLTYRDRFSIHGSVVDGDGLPVEGVLVSSFFGGVSVLSDAEGSFSLTGLPNGNWPIAAAKNGWTFYNQPVFASISGADTVVELVGNPGQSRFLNKEALPNNDQDFWTGLGTFPRDR